MSNLLRGLRRVVAPWPDDSGLTDRLQALADVVENGRGRLDRTALAPAERMLARAGERLRLSGFHTVVALAGGTGSGKSSLFNAIAGLDLVPVGVRRPTTDAPYACVWGGMDGTGPLLDWLKVPDERRISHESELDAGREQLRRGLVLLDLPDQDSVVASHRMQVDRLVERVDLMVWVVDPQKYADGELHRRYLRPLAGHSEVVLVALNQVDRLDPEQARACVGHLRRMLAEDGLPDVRLAAVSAYSGAGVPDLREMLTRAVTARTAAARRAGADLDRVAARLARWVGPPAEADRVGESAGPYIEELVEAADVEGFVGQMAETYRARGAALTDWPVLQLPGLRRASPPRPGTVSVLLPAVEAGGMRVAEHAAAELPVPWPARLRRVARDATPPVAEALDRARHERELRALERPRWWSVVWAVHWVLLGVAAAGIASAVALRSMIPLVGTAAVLAAGLVLALVARRWVRRAAWEWEDSVADELRQETADAGDHRLLAAMRAELQAYADLREAIHRLQRRR